MKYLESQIITYNYCPVLYNLNGDVTELSKAQSFYKDLVMSFNAEIIKKTLKDIDLFLNKHINKNIDIYYPLIKTIDDRSYLHSYFSDLFFKYLKIFPSEKYLPVYIDYTPEIYLNEKLIIKLKYDLILRQNNKDGFLHAICFEKAINNHLVENNIFNFIKLKELKNIYKSSKRKHEPVKLHLLMINDPTFRNRNKRTYSLKHFRLDLNDYKNYNLKEIIKYLKFFKTKNYNSKFYCNDFKCTKRKECTDANSWRL